MDWLLQFDMSVFRAIHIGWSNPVLDLVMTGLTMSGLGQVQFLFGALLMAFKNTRAYGFPVMIVVLIAGLPIAQLLKALVPRDRPSNLVWAHPHELIYSNSFPSGHTTTSFAIAVLLALMTWRSRFRWMGIVALSWAPFVGLSRIYLGVHWPTDVLGGACAGVFSGGIVYLLFQKSLGSQWTDSVPNP